MRSAKFRSRQIHCAFIQPFRNLRQKTALKNVGNRAVPDPVYIGFPLSIQSAVKSGWNLCHFQYGNVLRRKRFISDKSTAGSLDSLSLKFAT